MTPPTPEDIEAIRASRLFDAEWYLKIYPDVKVLGIDPAEHYLWFGARLKRRPSQEFDAARYLELHPDVAAAGLNPLLHYERTRKDALHGLNDQALECAVLRVANLTKAPVIIVPVYNGPGHVEQCIRSVVQHTAQPYRLILLDDGSPDPRIQELLRRYGVLPNVTVASNGTNLGYTATINRGIRLAGDADVILLNSDTQVTPLWLRNLQLAAYSGERVATATPLSNNAGAFSAPHAGQSNAIPEELGLDAYARLITRKAARLYPTVPTGSGFCMYIRRACLNETGPFDADAFPRGYGEENDFCLRAAATGWTHVVDDATLIGHVRSASFGNDREQLSQAGRAVVDQRYPHYPKAVEAMFADPRLQQARRNVEAVARTPLAECSVQPRILFVISTMSGGTPRTNEDLMGALADRAEAFVLQCDSRIIKLFGYSGGQYTELNSHVLQAPTRAFPHRSDEYDAVLRTWLVRYAFECVHVRHIGWHSLGLIDEARRVGLPVIFSFHDYYAVCPTVKLLDDQMAYCGGHCTPGAGRCRMELWNTDDYPGLKHAAVHDWRKQFHDVLAKCSAFVTTSSATRQCILDAFPALQDRTFEIIPHGRDFSHFDEPEPSWRPQDPLRLLVPGHIVPAKGRDVVAALGKRAKKLGLEIHILGSIDPAIPAAPGVVLHQDYARDEFMAKVQMIKPHIGGIFSIWPETFCHTLTELWACGIPVVAFDTGAVADRIRAHGGGWLADLGDLDGITRRLAGIKRDHAEYKRKLHDIRRWQVEEGRVHTSRWMAERYWQMYADVAPGLNNTPQGSSGVIEAAMKRLAATPAGAAAADALETRPAGNWHAYEELVLSPATRRSVFGRKLLAILREDTPTGIGMALRDSEAALEKASARLTKNERPLVSVIMPTHNRAGIIGDAIRSVVEQDYDNWELLVCDDASTDRTESVVAGFRDARIQYLRLDKAGAAAARNAGLVRAQGDIFAYLDSDNFWHPRYLSRMVVALLEQPGHSAVYGNFIDYFVDTAGNASIESFFRPRFDPERLLRKNYIDLNTFAHRRELYDCFGGFNRALTRRQDYDLIIKYTWLRDPLQVEELVALYQRNAALKQITEVASKDDSCVAIINDSIERYLAEGLPAKIETPVKRVTILSWDLCRNHFSKPFALAEALSHTYEIQLISFRFFDEEIFQPLKGENPSFETVYLPGSKFPDFYDPMDKAVEAINGEVIYVVKPRLPSLGTALLANARRGTPVILETNDLETVVGSPTSRDRHQEVAFDGVDPADPELLSPYSDLWSQILDPIARTLPVLATHNKFIDAHFGHKCLYMRNLKDEAVYDPALYDRNAVRAELGFAPGDRIILFGGMVRKHKGIYELVELVERLDDKRYMLLFVGSRTTPDQTRLIEKFGQRVRVLPPQDRKAMARINLAADLVVLWLDPDVPASHAQMPYKATDALAMKTPIIANDISDLGDLARQGYLRLVPFGDWDRMAEAVHDIFADESKTAAMREAGRRLYQRQFSYAAARGEFALMLNRVATLDAGPLPAAREFARRFEEVRRALAGGGAKPVEAGPAVAAPAMKAPIRPSDSKPAGVAPQTPLTRRELDDLARDYRAKGLDKLEDTFVLYRIIGNDLPPRHKTGQSRENLRFILHNEPELEGCEKRYIVNRIFDPAEEAAIVRLLEEAGAPYDRIAFDGEEYGRIGFDLGALGAPGALTAEAIEAFEEIKRERLQLALYRLKNNYVMNNNGARNFALRAGRSRAKWVLPFDGNCFLTAPAWRQLRRTVTGAPQLKYFVVPMARVQRNSDLLDGSFVPDAREEPQILFRKDAQEEFNEAFCYGRRPKVELFWRLGVAGKWDDYRDDSWDQKRAPAAAEARQFGVAGWVARLSSGMTKLEVQTTAGADSRYLSRAEAILTTLRSLDSSLSAGGAAPTPPAEPPLDAVMKALSVPVGEVTQRSGPDPQLEQTRKVTPRDNGGEAAQEDASIVTLDVTALDRLHHSDVQGVAVVMPSIDTARARETARLLVRRAGMATTVFVVEDTLRQGFIPTLNAAAAKLDVKYLVYLAEDAFPGTDWLRVAHDALESSGKGLLAFNDGKWKGRIAAYGMVRMDWVRTLYGGAVFYPAYKAHKADNELTVIARLRDTFVYEPNATLVEYDPHKVFTDKVREDRTLFDDRFRNGFDGLVDKKDVVPLAAEYFVKLKPKGKAPGRPPARESDSFVLYRILGNDLFPRHQKGQSRRNLQFILKHEPQLERCEKRYVVNRIFDAEEEKKLIALLEAHGCNYVRIPFVASEYRMYGYDTDAFEAPGFLASKQFESLDRKAAASIPLTVYRLKNNYLMNNNGARNAALRDGRNRARWVLPWDGNCFLTADAWQQIQRSVAASSDKKYFIVPMARVTDNAELLSVGHSPEALEEPQVMFRNDANETFNENFCYGRRPKVELLWRLGVAGKWDDYRIERWDQARRPISPEAGSVGTAGWVARLFSGMKHLEKSSFKSHVGRGESRVEAIVSTINLVDAELAGAGPDRFTCLQASSLDRETHERDRDPALKAVIDSLMTDAESAIRRGLHSVVDKTTLPPSGNRQDYWHPAPYWWPNPDSDDGLPFVNRDGLRVPGTRMYEPESGKYDRTRLQHVFDDSFILALGWQFSGQRRLIEHAAQILERFFIDPHTRMTPHLNYAQVRMGHAGDLGTSTGVIEMKDLYYYLDAVRIMRAAGAVSDDNIGRFKEWLKAYLDWLLTSRQGKGERSAANNHGNYYDLQVAAIAAFLDERTVLFDTLARAQSRIAQHFAPDGSQPHELARTTTAHYCCFNFQGWVNLAELAGRWNIDLWSYRSRTGVSLEQGARWLLGHMGRPWPHKQIDDFDSERFHPIAFALPAGFTDAMGPAGLPQSRYHAKPRFFPHDGIRPFWNIGSAIAADPVVNDLTDTREEPVGSRDLEHT